MRTLWLVNTFILEDTRAADYDAPVRQAECRTNTYKTLL